MSHPYATHSLFDTVDEADASSSTGPNSSPDFILPVYSDLPDDIPFMQLDTDMLPGDDDETDEPRRYILPEGGAEIFPSAAPSQRMGLLASQCK
jgi:hypothetical protein